MSWWVSLLDTTQHRECQADCPEPCYPAFRSESFEDGGTYAVGGSTETSMNITYNYSPYYYGELDAADGLRALHGERAGNWTDRIAAAVEALGTTRDSDYWARTPGNAGAALARLLAWSRAYPDGVWSVN